MPSVVVLGAGMVGSVMACDLAGDCDVTVADARPGALEAAAARARTAHQRVHVREADLSDAGQVASPSSAP